MTKIRKFVNKDAKKVSFLIRKNLLEVNSKYYPKTVINFMQKYFTPKKIIEDSKRRRTFVALQNKSIVGTLSFDKKGVHAVFVNPKYHNKGIGKLLMNYIENAARKKGYKTIKLASSKNAVGFYQKLGYVKVKQLYSKEWGDNTLMKKKL